MTAKVKKFYTATNPDHVLEQAVGQYKKVLVLGWDRDGNFDPRSDLSLTKQEANWLIDIFKNDLMNGGFQE